MMRNVEYKLDHFDGLSALTCTCRDTELTLEVTDAGTLEVRMSKPGRGYYGVDVDVSLSIDVGEVVKLLSGYLRGETNDEQAG